MQNIGNFMIYWVNVTVVMLIFRVIFGSKALGNMGLKMKTTGI